MGHTKISNALASCCKPASLPRNLVGRTSDPRGIQVFLIPGLSSQPPENSRDLVRSALLWEDGSWQQLLRCQLLLAFSTSQSILFLPLHVNLHALTSHIYTGSHKAHPADSSLALLSFLVEWTPPTWTRHLKKKKKTKHKHSNVRCLIF